MNLFSLLLSLCAVLAYAPTVGAYTTSLTVIASANAAFGSQSYDSDSRVMDTVDSPANYAVDALYQIPDPIRPGSFTAVYRSAAGGYVNPGVLKAEASASATAFAGNVASGSSKVSFTDDFRLVGPSGRNIDLTLSYLV